MATGSYVPPPPAGSTPQAGTTPQVWTTTQPATPTPTTPSPQPVKPEQMIGPKAAGKLVLIGVLIFFIGSILVQTTVILKEPDYEDYDNPEDFADAVEGYRDLRRNLFGFGKILNWVGAMIIALPLYVIGMSSEKLDWKIRASMLSAATALIIATMIVTMFITFY
jgi:hypothetical protein